MAQKELCLLYTSPYGLDTPALLQKQLADYDAFYAAHHND